MSEFHDTTHLDPETQEMIRSFVSESMDSLDTNEPLVEYLRQDDFSEYVNAIFRVFHTLKGLSGFFEMYVINRVTHEAETLLDIMRKDNTKQSEDSISIIYASFDFLRDLLQRVNNELTDRSAEAEAEDMILILQDAIDKIKNPEKVIAAQEEFIESVSAAPVISEVHSVEQIHEPATAKKETQSVQSDDDAENFAGNDMLEQYLTSANELIDTAENNLLVLEKDPDSFELVGETFGAVHSLKGNSGFMGYSEIEEIAVEMETILDCIRSKELEIDQTVITILLSNIETIRDRIVKIANANREIIKTEEVRPVATQAVKEAVTAPVAVSQPKQTIETVVKPTVDTSAVLHDDDEHDFEHDDDHDDFHETQAIPPAAKEKLSAKTAAAKPAAPAKLTPSQNFAQMQKKDIRVETSKIDKLFDLVGELITIETMVTNSPDLHGLSLPNFHKSANMLNKITRELQEITMSVRMMPLEGLFNKMKRLVRDVSLKMEKKVNFEVSGQETEMDKNVIDEIADPLVHILRNSIDHGVETPAVRAAAGKHEVGNVSLKAQYEGNEILIIVKDDGAGILRERILRKAIEKNVLTVNQIPEKMTDKEVFQLLFEPGFSTAEKLTDISGRGVGMDVVKKNIEKLHGSVDVMSVPGQGSTFTLRIPLTLAIMEAMVIRVGNARYALPLLAVSESFRTNMKNISQTMDGLEVVKLREEVLSIVRLHDLFHKDPDSTDLDKGILIVIESREKKVCLFADEIVGQQQAVIKGLSDYIGKVPGITGCMILGDGGIGLILDIDSLIQMAENNLVEY